MPTCWCCKSGYAIDDPTDTTDEAALRKALSDFLDAPQCLDESVFGKRGTTTSFKEYLENVIADAIDEIAETAAHLIVDEVLRKGGYACSSIAAYRAYKQATYILRSWTSKRFASLILCGLEYIDCLLCGNCKSCTDGTCGGPQDLHTATNLAAECADSDDGDGSKMKTFVQKREEVQYGSYDVYFPGDLKNSLQKRGGKTKKYFAYAGRPEGIGYFQQAYISAGQWDSNHPIYDRIFDYEDEGDCVNPRIAHIDPTRLPILTPQPHYYQSK